jgi:hypothetical protein
MVEAGVACGGTAVCMGAAGLATGVAADAAGWTVAGEAGA